MGGTRHPVSEPVVIRELRPEEFGRLSGIGPFAGRVVPATLPGRILVAESPTGHIVAIWGALHVIHVEPLWIIPDYRKNPGLGRRLLTRMRALLRDMGVTRAFAVLGPELPDLETRQAMARRLNFEPIPGDLYMVRLEE